MTLCPTEPLCLCKCVYVIQSDGCEQVHDNNKRRDVTADDLSLLLIYLFDLIIYLFIFSRDQSHN